MANIFKNVAKDYTTSYTANSLQDIYTVPGGTVCTIVIGFNLVNTISSDIVLEIKLDSNTQDDIYLLKGFSLPTASSVEIMAGNKIVLETGDKIQVASNQNDSFDVMLSILEQT
tara:strand:+ start:205 stop:546 length:342 start_codon:yes stop_codon:yes gene_type:complete